VFPILTAVWISLAMMVFVAGFFFTAPYGRYFRDWRGPSVEDRIGWLIMEAPAVFVFGALFLVGTNRHSVTILVFLVLWEVHYVYRCFIYPFVRRTKGKRMALAVLVLGFWFNCVNAYLNGRQLFTFSGAYTEQWISDPRFLVGLVLFFAGFVINRRADRALARLRASGQCSYEIPYGGLYHWISCPNYFGELIQWIGWATATWSAAGLAFALWTTANLIPRARAHDSWYRGHFSDYPPERKILLPGLW